MPSRVHRIQCLSPDDKLLIYKNSVNASSYFKICLDYEGKLTTVTNASSCPKPLRQADLDDTDDTDDSLVYLIYI